MATVQLRLAPEEEYTQEIGALIYLVFFGNPWAVP